MKQSLTVLWAIGVLQVCVSGAAPGATVTWTNTVGTNDWFVGANWSGGSYPTNGDDVIITNTIAGNNFGVLLTNSTDSLSSILLSNKCTLIFSNWDTALSAANVSILTNATMTLPAAFTNNAMSNRVWIVCSNLTIDAGGLIDANARGYLGGVGSAVGNGPGKGSGILVGAGHGGYGGNVIWNGDYMGGPPYDSTNAPVFPGSGGSGYSAATGGAGGGAVRINATGTVTLNGTIRANGGNGTASYGGGGSGGSIWISCSVATGTSGAVSANGGSGNSWAGGGGGGRIAVIYNTAAQTAAGRPRITFTAAYGSSLYAYDYGMPGTLYFTDGAILDGAWFPHAGQIFLDAPEWNPGNLVVSNVWAFFPMEGFRLTVTNDVRIEGASGQLDIGGNAYWRTSGETWTFFYSSMTSLSALHIGGNLTLTNGGRLYVYGGVTNSTTTNYGALVSVTGDVFVASNSTIVSRSNPSNGGSPLFRARNLTVLTNGTIDASAKGFHGGSGGYGPGFPGGAGAFPSGWGAAGGYGGKGGPDNNGLNAGATYGLSNAPIEPGSGGRGYTSYSGSGGGLVRIEASNTVRIDGIVYAQGGSGVGGGSWSGSGSGGGIYIRCKIFTGNPGGLLNASGGSSGTYNANSGGGGRIAVWRMYHEFLGSANATNGTAPGYTTNGLPGTIVWGQLPLPGTIITMK